MQSSKPAERLLQRLLQSDKIRNHYVLLLENENGSTKISLQLLETNTGQPEPCCDRFYSSALQRFFPNDKDFFGGN